MPSGVTSGDPLHTILVVDDVAIVAEAVSRMLRHGRYTVITVASAEEALLVLADPSNRVDLLLSDVVLIGMNGFDLAREARKALPELPLLFMSAYVDLQDTEPPFGARLLQKPFTRSEIILAVAHELRATPPKGSET